MKGLIRHLSKIQHSLQITRYCFTVFRSNGVLPRAQQDPNKVNYQREKDANAIYPIQLSVLAPSQG